MIPVATLTDLDDEHAKHSVALCKFRDFITRVKPSGECTEFLRVHIGQFNQLDLATNRAVRSGLFAMPFGGPQQIRIRIAGIGVEATGAQHVEDRGLPRQRVVNDLSWNLWIRDRFRDRGTVGSTRVARTPVRGRA